MAGLFSETANAHVSFRRFTFWGEFPANITSSELKIRTHV